jgi:hypothetical protein
VPDAPAGKSIRTERIRVNCQFEQYPGDIQSTRLVAGIVLHLMKFRTFEAVSFDSLMTFARALQTGLQAVLRKRTSRSGIAVIYFKGYQVIRH